MGRLEDLQGVRNGLLERMANESSSQNYAVMGRLLVDVVKQIDELAPPEAKPESKLDEFTQALRERQSSSAPARKAKGG